MVFRSADDDWSMHRSIETMRQCQHANINRHCWQVHRESDFSSFTFFLVRFRSVSGVTCPIPKVDYDRRFRVKLFAPLLTTFEVFAQQLASYLGASSASTIRQFNSTSTIVPSSSELFIEHVENRTVLVDAVRRSWRHCIEFFARHRIGDRLRVLFIVDNNNITSNTSTTRTTTPIPRHSTTQQLSTSLTTQSTDSLTSLPTNNNNNRYIIDRDWCRHCDSRPRCRRCWCVRVCHSSQSSFSIFVIDNER
jgi:hypothetical protein